jgi:integrase
MGHISKTPAGNFRANWRDPVGDQKAKTFKTRKQAAAYLSEIEDSLNKGTYLDPAKGRLRFGDHAQRWLAGRHVEARTHERTLSVMRVHILPKWAEWKLAKIEHMAVQEWINDLARKLSPASVAKCHGTLSMVIGSAVRARLIPFNPCEGVKLPSTHKPQRPALALSKEDFFERLLPAAPHEHRALIATPAGCGLRWGECIGLTWSAIDFGRNVLRVVQVVIESGGARSIKPFPKSRAGVRSVPMPRFLRHELETLRSLKRNPDPASLVFATRTGLPPLRATFRREVWRPSLVRAGLLGSIIEMGPHKWRATWPDESGMPWDKEFTTERDAVAYVAEKSAGGLRFHDLRHTYATWLVSDGVPVNIVQKVMGHESASTTLNLYTHAPHDYEGRIKGVFDDLI